MKHLKKFETAVLFQAAQDNLEIPNVSLVEETYELQFIPYEIEYIEIGGIKWAPKNLGANKVTDIGLYFQWGKTQGYSSQSAAYDIEYVCDEEYSLSGDNITLQSEDDAVTAIKGGNWRMPTEAEVNTLLEATNILWTDDYKNSGVSGFILRDKTNSSKELFFPQIEYNQAKLWISNVNEAYRGEQAAVLNFEVYDDIPEASAFYEEMRNGFPVRGILDE